MKKLLALMTCLICFNAMHAQNQKINYTGRSTPVIKIDKVQHLNFICELMPDFEHYFRAESKTHSKFIELLQIQRGNKCALLFPADNYIHARADYENMIDYQNIEIIVKQAGKYTSAFGNSHSLNAQQKAVLSKADIGSEVVVKIKFKFKAWVNTEDKDHGIKEAEYSFSVIPEVEAMMPGGYLGFSDYLNKKLLSAFPGKNNFEKIQMASIQFLVNENGEIQAPKLIRSSSDKNIDQAIIKLIAQMTPWKPAKDAKGMAVKEEFIVTLGNYGC